MRTNVTRQFRSRERKCMGTKRPGTGARSAGDSLRAIARCPYRGLQCMAISEQGRTGPPGNLALARWAGWSASPVGRHVKC